MGQFRELQHQPFPHIFLLLIASSQPLLTGTQLEQIYFIIGSKTEKFSLGKVLFIYERDFMMHRYLSLS